MSENLRELIQEAFSECHTLNDVARIYFDIRTECERQLTYANFNIAKEMRKGDRIEVI